MSKKLQCIITGKSMLISDSYYQNKVDKAGGEERLHKTYISREAKKLLKLGNSVEKVRDLLGVTQKLAPVDEQYITELVFGSKTKTKFNQQNLTDFTSLTSITHSKTDPEVKLFIKKIKQL